VGKSLIGAFTDAPYVTSQLLQIVKPHEGVDATALLGILNSKLIGYYFRKKYNRQDKAFPEIRIYELRSLPLRGQFFDGGGDTAELAELVLKAAAAREAKPDADVSALESEIDQIVYKIYDLTPEEIAIVEESATSAAMASGDSKKKASKPKKTRRKRKAKLPAAEPGWD